MAHKRFHLAELDSALLADTEVPGFTLVNQNLFYWWKGKTPEGEGLFQAGVGQDFCDDCDRLLIIAYARFADSAEARSAAQYYPKNVAAVFRAGLWDGWENRGIGDSSWVVVSRTHAGLMVQKGTLCLLISCHILDVGEAQRLAFSVAERILAKEARRGEQEPAPQAPPEPIERFRVPELDGVLLDESEVPAFTPLKQNEFKWWKGRGDNAEVLHQVGIFQRFRDPHNGVVFVRYARFSDPSEAREACEYYPKHVGLAFREGLWRRWQKLTMADACWVCRATILMVQKGSLCLLISCYIGDADEAQRLALSLAQKILAKEARPADDQTPPESNKAPDSP